MVLSLRTDTPTTCPELFIPIPTLAAPWLLTPPKLPRSILVYSGAAFAKQTEARRLAPNAAMLFLFIGGFASAVQARLLGLRLVRPAFYKDDWARASTFMGYSLFLMPAEYALVLSLRKSSSAKETQTEPLEVLRMKVAGANVLRFTCLLLSSFHRAAL